MATTPALAIPYPTGPNTPDVPYWAQQLAERVDTLLVPVKRTTPVAFPYAASWGDHGTVASLTLGAVQTTKAADGRVSFDGSAKRTGSTTSTTTATLGTLAATFRPAVDVETIIWTTGGAAALGISASTGVVVVAWLTSQSLTSGTYRIDFTGVNYQAATP